MTLAAMAATEDTINEEMAAEQAEGEKNGNMVL